MRWLLESALQYVCWALIKWGQAYACEEKNMAAIQTTTNPGLIEEGKHSAVNWGAVIAGSVTTAALTRAR
jgi:hypothetical protein